MRTKLLLSSALVGWDRSTAYASNETGGSEIYVQALVPFALRSIAPDRQIDPADPLRYRASILHGSPVTDG